MAENLKDAARCPDCRNLSESGQHSIDCQYKEDLTLEEIFAELRKELDEIKNPPLSFTTAMLMREIGISKSKANDLLKEYEQQGKVVRIKYQQKDKNGNRQVISGWQWITNKPHSTD